MDITTPAVTVAEGENKDSMTGEEEVEVHAGYNLRRGPPPAKMEQRELEEDGEFDADHYYRGPDAQGPGGMEQGLRLKPYDGSTSWPEYLVYFKQMAATVLGLSLRGAARKVLVSLAPEQRRDLRQLTGGL